MSVSLNPSLLNEPGQGGWTALHWAAAGDHAEVVRFLLSIGARDDVFDRQGHTPLYWAAHYHEGSEVTSLLSEARAERYKREQTEAEITGQREQQVQQFHEAAKCGDIERLEQMLTEQADLVNAKDVRNFTALRWAAGNGHLAAVRLLVARGANLEDTFLGGMTAIKLAASHGHANVVEHLIESGANLSIVSSEGKFSLLHSAVLSHNPATVKVLIDAGLNLNARNAHEQTPLHLAAYSDYGQQIFHHILDTDEKVDWTALRKQQSEIIEMLTAAGADTTLRDKDGRTPQDILQKESRHYT